MRIFVILSFIFILSLGFSNSNNEKNHAKNKSKSKSKDEDVNISDKYFLGSILIYDCHLNYFACVSEASYERCLRERQEAFERKDDNASCIPIKKYPSNRKCFNNQYTYIHGSQKIKAFCFLGVKVKFN